MLKFQWNALRPGHRVLVHDADGALALRRGVVVLLDSSTTRDGANGVGIQVAGDDGTRSVHWPDYPAVHLDPDDLSEPCWRCAAIAGPAVRGGDHEVAGPPSPRVCGRCRGDFPGDDTLPVGVDVGTWYCPPCRELLIGAGATPRHSWPAKR